MSLAAAAACAVWRVLDPNPENRLVAVVLGVVAVLVALALNRIKVRLSANSSGLTITGFARSRTVAWADVDAISTPRRGRFGRRGASLEIEVRPPADPRYDDFPGSAGEPDGGAAKPDTELVVFGAFELGADPAAVGRALSRLWR